MYQRLAATLIIALCYRLATAEFIVPAAPIMTGNLGKRQDLYGCPEATQTVCPDGVGCCPSGVPCTQVSGKPRCQMSCNGGPICDDGGCCEVGYVCNTKGNSLCIPAPTDNPFPSLTLPSIGPIVTDTSFPEIPTFEPSASSTALLPTDLPPSSSSMSGGGSSTDLGQSGGGSSSQIVTDSEMPSQTVVPSSAAGPSSSAAGSGSSTVVPGMASSQFSEWTSCLSWLFAWFTGMLFVA
ncbi:hypothetical protein PHISCL_02367 [Aspergillus sclerotialis]|uniref:GPI anchored protein n=1 Tax=Aspergillus sclerotialis TaxID=2070753 RepID=A0A3A2ZQ41_9EURO|nr:hypothetical protein PHISCL_02367 [Aspergillus sclerotialis]